MTGLYTGKKINPWHCCFAGPILLRQAQPTIQTWVGILITSSGDYLFPAHSQNARHLNIAPYLLIHIAFLNTSLCICRLLSLMKMLLICSEILWKVNSEEKWKNKALILFEFIALSPVVRLPHLVFFLWLDWLEFNAACKLIHSW